MSYARRRYGVDSKQYRKAYAAALEKNVLAENNRTAPKPTSPAAAATPPRAAAAEVSLKYDIGSPAHA